MSFMDCIITVDRQQFIDAVKVLRELPCDSRQICKFTYENNQMQLSAGGFSFGIDAHGSWVGQVTVPISFIHSLIQLQKGNDPLEISAEDGVICIDDRSAYCNWDSYTCFGVELPSTENLLTTLAIKLKHSEKEISEANLNEALSKAEARRDKIIERALGDLHELGISKMQLTDLVNANLKEVNKAGPAMYKAVLFDFIKNKVPEERNRRIFIASETCELSRQVSTHAIDCLEKLLLAYDDFAYERETGGYDPTSDGIAVLRASANEFESYARSIDYSGSICHEWYSKMRQMLEIENELHPEQNEIKVVVEGTGRQFLKSLVVNEVKLLSSYSKIEYIPESRIEWLSNLAELADNTGEHWGQESLIKFVELVNSFNYEVYGWDMFLDG